MYPRRKKKLDNRVRVPSITLGDELIILTTGNDYADPHAQFLQETEQVKVSVPSITLEKELIILTTGNDYTDPHAQFAL